MRSRASGAWRPVEVAPQLGAMGFKNNEKRKLEASFPAPIDVSERTGEQSELTLNPGNCNSFLVRHPLSMGIPGLMMTTRKMAGSLMNSREVKVP